MFVCGRPNSIKIRNIVVIFFFSFKGKDENRTTELFDFIYFYQTNNQ